MMKALKLQRAIFVLKVKERLRFGLIVILVTMLFGCVGHTSREYLEEFSGKELSFLYTTKNVEELFEQFPKGFSISQTRRIEDSVVYIHLNGTEKGKPLEGTIKKVNANTKEEEKVIPFQYVNGQFVFANEEEAKTLLPQGRFLFQKLHLSKDILAKLKLQTKKYTNKEDSPLGDKTFRLEYLAQLPELHHYLGMEESAPVNFFVVGRDEEKGFRYEIGTMEDAKTSLWEMVEEKE